MDTFEINDGVLTGYNGSEEKVIVPETVTSIGPAAFFYIKTLKSVVLPEGLVSIENGAFSGCENLTEINIPDSIKKIGLDAFRDSGIKSIELNEKMDATEIALNIGCEYTFRNYRSSDVPADFEGETLSDYFVHLNVCKHCGGPKRVYDVECPNCFFAFDD